MAHTMLAYDQALKASNPKLLSYAADMDLILVGALESDLANQVKK